MSLVTVHHIILHPVFFVFFINEWFQSKFAVSTLYSQNSVDDQTQMIFWGVKYCSLYHHAAGLVSLVH